jgi:hypothetical protein
MKMLPKEAPLDLYRVNIAEKSFDSTTEADFDAPSRSKVLHRRPTHQAKSSSAFTEFQKYLVSAPDRPHFTHRKSLAPKFNTETPPACTFNASPYIRQQGFASAYNFVKFLAANGSSI